MATTPNYGWVMPDPTDFVTSLPADFEIFGDAVDATVDGIETTANAALPETIIDAAGDLIYGSAADTAARLAIGTAGQVLTVNTGATAPEWTTPATGGAITWTFRHRPSGAGSYRSVAYNGSNLYVAVGSSGILATSPDGKTWTSRTSSFGSTDIRDVVYDNGIWVIVGSLGLISSSTDGITWTARTANMSTNVIRRVVYANGYFIAVGNGGGTTNTGGLTYSTDGITWTRKNQSITVGTAYYDVIWNGTNWIITASNSTNNFIRATDPTATWTAGQAGDPQTISFIKWDGTRHIFGCESTWSIFYSTATDLSSDTQIGNVSVDGTSADQASKLHFLYNNRFYSVDTYLQQWSVSLTNDNVPLSPAQFLPEVFYRGGVSINKDTYAIYVDNNGLIYLGQTGSINTSY
jgi:hypothetical protein